MKNSFFRPILIFSLILWQSSSVLAQRCESLFTEQAQKTTSEYLTVTADSSLEGKSVLNLTTQDFSANPKKSALEIIRRSMLNSSFAVLEKNFLNKDKLTLGFSVSPDHILEVIYGSESRLEDQFIIEQINLRTVTGYKLKVAENILTEDAFELKSHQFDIAKYLPAGQQINLRIPMAIRGDTLKYLADYAKSFDLFSKQELRQLFNEKTEAQISRALFLRKAKELFYKVLVKEPFKIVIGGAMMFSILNADRVVDMVPTDLLSKPAITQQVPLETVQFEHTVKNAQGQEVKLKVTAKETTQMNKVDYSIVPVK